MKRRSVTIGIVGVCLITAVVGLVLYLRRDQLPDPARVDLPPPVAEASAVRMYFRADGHALVELLNATSNLPATNTPAACADLAASLDQVGGPPALTKAATGVPDPGIRDAAVNHLDAVGTYLSACGRSAPLEEPARTATFSAVVLHRLLAREGVL